jgi:hypothetical protein
MKNIIEKMIADGVTYSVEKEREIIGVIGDYMKANGFSEKQINYYFNIDEDFLGDVLGELPVEVA